MIKSLIFDLDNCLASSKEPGEQLFEPAFEAIRRANRGRLPPEALEAAFEDCWRLALDAVAEKHGFSEDMLRAGWEAFQSIEVTTPMRGYGDLEVLTRLPMRHCLVTSGFRRLQESKIRALGLARWFAERHVDAIDEPNRPGKEGLFRRILSSNGYSPEQVLVLGDNPESEIEVGNRLGMRTVQTLRPGIEAGGNATWTIRDLSELESLLAAC